MMAKIDKQSLDGIMFLPFMFCPFFRIMKPYRLHGAFPVFATARPLSTTLITTKAIIIIPVGGLFPEPMLAIFVTNL